MIFPANPIHGACRRKTILNGDCGPVPRLYLRLRTSSSASPKYRLVQHVNVGKHRLHLAVCAAALAQS